MRKLTTPEAHLLHRYFFAVALDKMQVKREDYSGKAEPFKNFYESARISGVEAWRGALTRLADKLSRYTQLSKNGGVGKVKDEPIEDSIIDALNYPPITLMVWAEENAPDLLDGLLAKAQKYFEEHDHAETTDLVRG